MKSLGGESSVSRGVVEVEGSAALMSSVDRWVNGTDCLPESGRWGKGSGSRVAVMHQAHVTRAAGQAGEISAKTRDHPEHRKRRSS
jgi:hypothetical protein